MALVTQITEVTRAALVAKTPIRLYYATGTLPTSLTTIFDKECFLTGLWLHNSNGAGAKVTIQEANGSNFFWQEYTLKADEFYALPAAAVAALNSRKFYSGISVLSSKENVHCQIRCFHREV